MGDNGSLGEWLADDAYIYMRENPQQNHSSHDPPTLMAFYAVAGANMIGAIIARPLASAVNRRYRL
ncbi:hypothetical protein CW748_05625 [Alteromonadales bacterium alter-6D02]|nr:hypothetical protein CW748_05625 [Alteromonadales bacterium alter-6D02]